ncbi:MAG: hypothetical protein ABI706_16645 [Ilumatobacteraceae bacterium]
MTRARARSLWLAGTALLVGCSSSSGAQSTTAPSTTIADTVVITPTPAASATPAPTSTAPTTTLPPASTLVPVDPTALVPIAVGNTAFPADADALVSQYHGFTGDPNATLQAWLISPMAVPSGPDVRLLGFERSVGINTTTATYLTGRIDPVATLAGIQAALAPAPTYTVTPSTRTEGTATIYGFDAQPTTVQGDPPGWTVEASAADQLGIIRIKRRDYAFAKVVPTFSDLPSTLQSSVLNQDAIAVNVGGVLRSINYEYGVQSLGDSPTHRSRLSYDLSDDFLTARAKVSALLTSGWETNEQPDVLYFTSTTTSEVWSIDDVGGFTHLTYDTGS